MNSLFQEIQRKSDLFLSSPPASIILWGSGEAGIHCYKSLKKHGLQNRIIAFLDSDTSKINETLFSIPIYTPDKLMTEQSSAVILCSQFHPKMQKYMKDNGCTNPLYFFERRVPFIQLQPKGVDERHLRSLYQSDPMTELSIDTCLFLREQEDYGCIMPYEYAAILPAFFEYWDSAECSLDRFQQLSLVDAGAYIGDTIENMHSQYGKKIEKIFAFEPDIENYAKLVDTITSKGLQNFSSLYQCGLSDTNGIYAFSSSMTTSTFAIAGDETIETRRLDDLALDPMGKLCIKMDIEGSELQALNGARETIQKYKPELAICVYHKYEDLWEIPQLIKDISSDYHCILRCGPHMECYASTERYE